MLRTSGASDVICSTRQPGMGKKSAMVHAMGSRASTGHYQSTPVTIHAKCERATEPGQSQAKTPIEVWHQDEARVGQQGTLAYVWAKRGSRPTAPKDLRYEWA